MKSKKNLLDQLKNLSYFEKDTVIHLGIQLGLKNATIDTYISRFLKYKEILKLRRGLYVSADFYNKNKADVSYLFYLANVIRKPSYISSWTALQYYNLATESIYGVTSVSRKSTRTYGTKIASFSYQSIQKELFADFSLIKGKFSFFIASPAKSLFDLLYFRTYQFRGIRTEDIKPLIEELRIDINEMDKNEQDKFYTITNKYLNHG